MTTLFAIWTPGPVELTVIIIFVISFAITVEVTRWIFRINKQIDLLLQIRDELKKLNSSER